MVKKMKRTVESYERVPTRQSSEDVVTIYQGAVLTWNQFQILKAALKLAYQVKNQYLWELEKQILQGK